MSDKRKGPLADKIEEIQTAMKGIDHHLFNLSQQMSLVLKAQSHFAGMMVSRPGRLARLLMRWGL